MPLLGEYTDETIDKIAVIIARIRTEVLQEAVDAVDKTFTKLGLRKGDYVRGVIRSAILGTDA